MRIVIPVFDGITTLDAVGPYEVLRQLPDAEVVFAADRPGVVQDEYGFLGLRATAALDDVDAADVLLVPGGAGARRLAATDEHLLDWIRRIHPTTTWTTSVCTGSILLAAAGLLRGLTAASHWSAADLYAPYGATYTPDRVVVHAAERIVTAAGVSSGIDMALTLTDLIAGRTAAEAAQLAIEYDPQPPFDAGSWAKAPQPARDLLTARR